MKKEHFEKAYPELRRKKIEKDYHIKIKRSSPQTRALNRLMNEEKLANKKLK